MPTSTGRAARSRCGRGTSSPRAIEHRRDWFERVVAAHHLIAAMLALFAFGQGRIRRWLSGRGGRAAQGWSYADRLPVHRRRWPSWLQGRAGRVVGVVGPAVALAMLLAWLGW
jgi:hypothetical protein